MIVRRVRRPVLGTPVFTATTLRCMRSWKGEVDAPSCRGPLSSTDVIAPAPVEAPADGSKAVSSVSVARHSERSVEVPCGEEGDQERCVRECWPGRADAAVHRVDCRCGGGGSAARSGVDDLARVFDDIAVRADTAADDGARIGARQVPPAPPLFERVQTRARALAAPHLSGLDAAAAARLFSRACALRDAALPVVATARDPEQAVAYAASQLSVPVEKEVSDLATSLVEAGSGTEIVELLAGAAVCA